MLPALVLLFPVAVVAQEAKPLATAPGTLLTIYSSARLDDFDTSRFMKSNAGQIPGLAIVQQRRTLDLNEGENALHLADIASTVDFSSLSLQPVDPGSFKVLSQSLVEAVSDPDALLRRAVGHEIIINRKSPPLGDQARTPETIHAKLLAFDQNQLVLETSNRQLPIQIIPRNAEIAEIKLMADSAAPTTRPALWARVSSTKSAPQEATLTYHASGITWHADYDILLREDSKARLNSSITILNRTGVSFDEARINLIAAAPGSNLNAASRRFAEEVGKQTYSLPQPLSLPAEAAQRVPLIDGANVAGELVLALGAADYARAPAQASNYLAIDNSSKNGLGNPLPAGRVRVMKQQAADAAPILLADDILQAAGKDELILVRLGPASQVTAKREFNERVNTDRTDAVQMIQITLHNAAEHPQRVLLIEPRQNPAAQIVEKSDDFQVQSQSLIFNVTIPANGDKTVSYSLRRPAQ